MPTRKIGAQIGFVAVIGWAIIEYFGLRFKNALLVLSAMSIAWLIAIWRYREDRK